MENYNTRHPFSFRLSSCRTNMSLFSVFFQGPKFSNTLSSEIALETTSLASFKNNLKHFFNNFKVPNQSICSTYLCDIGDFFKSLWMIVLLFVKLPFEVRFLLAVTPRALNWVGKGRASSDTIEVLNDGTEDVEALLLAFKATTFQVPLWVLAWLYTLFQNGDQ